MYHTLVIVILSQTTHTEVIVLSLSSHQSIRVTCSLAVGFVKPCTLFLINYLLPLLILLHLFMSIIVT